jgi:hypothetical protein
MKSSSQVFPSATREAAAARKRLERERMRAEGYVLRQIWVLPAAWPAIWKYVLRRNKRQS